MFFWYTHLMKHRLDVSHYCHRFLPESDQCANLAISFDILCCSRKQLLSCWACSHSILRDGEYTTIFLLWRSQLIFLSIRFSLRYSWTPRSGCRILGFFEICFSSASVFVSLDICYLGMLCHRFWRAMAAHNDRKPILLFNSLSSKISFLPKKYSNHSFVLRFDQKWPTCLHKNPSCTFSWTFPLCQHPLLTFWSENDDLPNYLNLLHWQDSVTCHCFFTIISLTNRPHNTPTKFFFIRATSFTPNKFCWFQCR